MCHKKRIIFVLILFVFLVLIKICFSKTQLHELKDLVYNENLVLNVFINGNLCSYDKDSDKYYFSLESNSFDVSFNSLYDLDYHLEKIDSNSYHVYAYNDEYYERIDLVITSLPIIDLKYLDLKKSVDLSFYDIFNSSLVDSYDEDLPDFISYFIDPKLGGSYYNDSLLSLRGSSSIWFNKKAYKLTFNEKVDLFNLPKDDKYVLDALYVDKSKIRNMLSGDMWNLINDNQTINNDLKGLFVELFIDDEYLGLYVFKEKVDKSVTRISDDGVILKSIFHIDDNIINKIKNNDFVISNDLFFNYEIKYYNDDSVKSIVSRIQNYYINGMNYDAISDNFILDNYFNYKVFVSLINGGDNVSYNQYYSLVDKDSKILITPWDMDLTWGINWNDFTRIRGFFNMDTCCDSLWMDTYIMAGMDYRSIGLLKQRYWELRRDVISMDVINKYLDNYKALLVNSGSASRDSYKWYRYNVSNEIEKIREWSNKRIQFLDEYFKL